MSGFETRWLDLREPADHAARNVDLLARAAAYAGAMEPDARTIVDLGCGTGSTLRALGPHLPQARWTLVDNDPALLAEAARRRPAGSRVGTLQADLVTLEGPVFDGARLVTASALFDLCSSDFLSRLAEDLRAAGAGLYSALSYDGETVWDAALEADDVVVDAFNRHQRRDKGFGPALGPAAGQALGEAFAAAGFAIAFADSPWRLGAETTALERAFVDGMVAAVAQTGDLDDRELRDWHAARRERLGQGLRVGHTDMLALPA